MCAAGSKARAMGSYVRSGPRRFGQLEGDSGGRQTLFAFSPLMQLAEVSLLQAVSDRHLSKSQTQGWNMNCKSRFTLRSLGWQEEHCPACGKFRFGL